MPNNSGMIEARINLGVTPKRRYLRKVSKCALATAFYFAFFQTVNAQPSATSVSDENAIKQTATDYIEGWYEGDATRMERALHPELAKRMVSPDSRGRSRLNQMSAMTLVESTRAGGGKNTPKEQQQKDITILDRFHNAAVVKIVASGWIDYLEEVKFDGKWKIINVLWELKPDTTKASPPATN
jgi:Putative lumazine-binding